jgi:hypothetical protein
MEFKPSINQTIRGRSTSTLNNKRYNLTEQSLQLKVTARLSKSTDDNILPLLLTIKYTESIPDLIINLNTGDKLFLTTFVNNIDLFEFKIEVENPNVSPAIIQIQESLSSPIRNMPFYPEGSSTPIADPALIAAVAAGNVATAANAAAIAGLTAAVAAQPTAIANAVNNDSTRTAPPELFVVDTVPVLVLTKNNLTRGANISNQGNTKIKLWCGDDPIASGTGYNSSGYLFHMEGKGSYEIPEPFYKSNVWAISNNAGGQISTTRSIDI